ncbi:MAG: serine protease, partial [Planctomycetota bacterium]
MTNAFDPYHTWFGIPPSEQPPNYYRLLGLTPFESNADVIEAAADQRLTFLRTKAAGEHAAEASRLMNEVTQARLTLLDPARRQAYDRLLQQLQGMAAPPTENALPQIRAVASPTVPKRTVKKRSKGRETTLIVGSIAVALLVMVGVVVLMMNMERYEPRPVEQTAQAPVKTPPKPAPEAEPPAAPEPKPEEPAPAEPPQEPADTPENPFHPVDEPKTPEVPVVPTSLEYSQARQAVVKVIAFSDLGETRATGVLMKDPQVVVTTHGAVEGAQRIQLEFANGVKTLAWRCRVSLGCDLAFLKPAQIDGLPEGAELAEREPPAGEGCLIIPATQGGSPIIESEIMAYLPVGGVRTLLAPHADKTELNLPRWNGETRWLRAKVGGGVRANGAPVFNADGRVLGVAVDTTGLLTDSVLAITAEQIKEQLDRQRPFTPMVSFAPVIRMDVRPAADAQNSIVPAFMSVDHVNFPAVALPNGQRITNERIAPPQNWARSIEQGYERLKQFFEA